MATQAEKLQKYRESQNPTLGMLSHIQSIKGDVGPQGPQGVQGMHGKDGRTITGPKGDKGERGAKGRDGLDGTNGKDGKDGKSPATINPQTIIDAVLERLTSGKKLTVEHIDGLAGSLGQLKDFLRAGGFRGGAGTIIAGSNVTVIKDGNGNPVVSSTGGSFSGTQEKSTTTPDGVSTTFAFVHPPKVIIWNGAIQALTDDYTVSANTITFTSSAGIPQTGDKVINIYA